MYLKNPIRNRINLNFVSNESSNAINRIFDFSKHFQEKTRKKTIYTDIITKYALDIGCAEK